MAYFVGGAPANQCQVSLRQKDGQQLAMTITDNKGNFIINIPESTEQGYMLHLDAGPGHSAVLPLGLAANKEPATASRADDRLELVLEQHLAPLRRQLLELQAANSAVTLEKVVAGLGYIAGILGLAVYLHYRQRLKQLNEKDN